LSIAVLQGDVPSIEAIANMKIAPVDYSPERQGLDSFGVRYHPLTCAVAGNNSINTIKTVHKLGCKDPKAIVTAMVICILQGLQAQLDLLVELYWENININQISDIGHTLFTAAVIDSIAHPNKQNVRLLSVLV